MTANQNAFFAMLSTLEVKCLEYQSVWNAKPSFKDPFEKLQTEVLDKLAAILGQQGQRSTGITIDKNRVRTTLEAQTLAIANGMEAYAATVGDNTLRQNVHLTASDLTRMSERTLIGEATRMATLATTNLSHLAPYDITIERIEALQTTKEEYSTWLGKPRAAIDDRKGATLQLGRLEDRARELLDLMDAQMVLFRTDAQAFYEQYWSGREIENPATHHRSITFAVCDEARKPVEGVTIVIPALRMEKCTGPGGGCFVERAPAGMYSARASKNGYQSAEATFPVNDGEGTKVELILKPL